jgi:hypothetical protein
MAFMSLWVGTSVNRAWEVEASVASVVFVGVVEPFAVVSAGAAQHFGTCCYESFGQHLGWR